MSDSSKPKMTIIPFVEWRREIATLWLMDGVYNYISATIDGAGQMQYTGRERARSVLCFPIACELDGQRVAWTSVLNISHSAIRIRGIYVLPEYRSNGIGFHMVRYAMSLWPKPWSACYMYARKPNLARYLRWGFTVPPGHEMRTWREGARIAEGAGEIVLVKKALNEDSA
jgi:GNAT superfamily N-acetyltransferase